MPESKPMTPEEFKTRMEELHDRPRIGQEDYRIEAEDIFIEQFIALGFGKAIRTFVKERRWWNGEL